VPFPLRLRRLAIPGELFFVPLDVLGVPAVLYVLAGLLPRRFLGQALKLISATFKPALEPGDFNHPRRRSHPRHLDDEMDHLRD
jgi:hypothetical protein